MKLKLTKETVTPFAYAKSAPTASCRLTGCYAALVIPHHRNTGDIHRPRHRGLTEALSFWGKISSFLDGSET